MHSAAVSVELGWIENENIAIDDDDCRVGE
jgi:hypothetical protein